MVIGITINNILRDHISQVKKAYEELTGLEPIEPINPFEMEKSFPTIATTQPGTEFAVTTAGEELTFTEAPDEGFNVLELMYQDASFEIFGRSEESVPGILHKLREVEKKCKVEFVLLNKESARSRCATLFFLSKNNFQFNKILFPDKMAHFWSEVDVLITDNPKILKAKPKDKISIKIINDFNVDIKSDYSIIDVDVTDVKTLKSIIKSVKNN